MTGEDARARTGDGSVTGAKMPEHDSWCLSEVGERCRGAVDKWALLGLAWAIGCAAWALRGWLS